MWYNIGMIYNWLIKHKKSAYGIAIGFLIFTILVYAFQSHWFVRHIYKYIDYWAIPLSAAFMLILAYMAYISIAENRRIREEDKEQESKRRQLDGIYKWVSDIRSTAGMQPDNARNLFRALNFVVLQREEMIKAATRFNGELKVNMQEAADKLLAYYNALFELDNGPVIFIVDPKNVKSNPLFALLESLDKVTKSIIALRKEYYL